MTETGIISQFIRATVPGNIDEHLCKTEVEDITPPTPSILPFAMISQPMFYRMRKQIWLPNTPIEVRISEYMHSPKGNILNPNIYVINFAHGKYQWIVYKRYKDFQALHANLKLHSAKEHLLLRGAGLDIPHLPHFIDAYLLPKQMPKILRDLEYYLERVLAMKDLKNHEDTLMFCQVSYLSFKPEYGPKGLEDVAKKRSGGYYGIKALNWFKKIFLRWRKRWVVLKDNYLAYSEISVVTTPSSEDKSAGRCHWCTSLFIRIFTCGNSSIDEEFASYQHSKHISCVMLIDSYFTAHIQTKPPIGKKILNMIENVATSAKGVKRTETLTMANLAAVNSVHPDLVSSDSHSDHVPFRGGKKFYQDNTINVSESGGAKDIDDEGADIQNQGPIVKSNEPEMFGKKRFKRNRLVIQNRSRKLLIKFKDEREAQEWLFKINQELKRSPVSTLLTQKHRYESFSPIRPDSYAFWFVDGASYFSAVADALYSAKEEIYITDWWLSPQYYLKRPLDKDCEKWRLDNILRKKAEDGVKIHILIYKEVALALGINSFYTKQALKNLHPYNIIIVRHPDHLKSQVYMWAHHEKMVCIDQRICFMGGLDICYARWDDYQHRLTDLGDEGVCTALDDEKSYLQHAKGLLNPKSILQERKFIPSPESNRQKLMNKMKGGRIVSKIKKAGGGGIGPATLRSGEQIPVDADSREVKDATSATGFNAAGQSGHPFPDAKISIDRYKRSPITPSINIEDGGTQTRERAQIENITSQGPSDPLIPEEDTLKSNRSPKLSPMDRIKRHMGKRDKSPATISQKSNGSTVTTSKLSNLLLTTPKPKNHLTTSPTSSRKTPSPKTSRMSLGERYQHGDFKRFITEQMRHRRVTVAPTSTPKLAKIVETYKERGYYDGTSKLGKEAEKKRMKYELRAAKKPIERMERLKLKEDENYYANPDLTLNVDLIGSGKYWIGKDYSNFIYKDFSHVDLPYADLIDRNSIPRMPWHDVGCVLYGLPASDAARHFIERWNFAVIEKYKEDPYISLLLPKLFQNMTIPQELADRAFNCEIQLTRSSTTWSVGIKDTENSIHTAYLDLIQNSKRFIYIENQFFVSVYNNAIVKNKISDALYNRIERAIQNKENFKVYIMTPLLPGFEGEIGGQTGACIQTIIHWNNCSMALGDNSLLGRLKKITETPFDYISFCSLRNYAELNGNLVTELIYIHSKMMVVDDEWCIIGSANINDRSMLGFRDSELAAIIKDVHFVTSTYKSSSNQAPEYQVNSGFFCGSLRKRLMREHLTMLDKESKIDFSDPSSDDFFKLWNETAAQNTLLFEEVFRCIPTDKALDFVSLAAYQKSETTTTNPDKLIQLSSTPDAGTTLVDSKEKKLEIPQISTDASFNNSSSETVIAPLAKLDIDVARKKLLEGVRGHLVQTPLLFLSKETRLLPQILSKEGLAPSTVFT